MRIMVKPLRKWTTRTIATLITRMMMMVVTRMGSLGVGGAGSRGRGGRPPVRGRPRRLLQQGQVRIWACLVCKSVCKSYSG
jgi:hypothetical protein